MWTIVVHSPTGQEILRTTLKKGVVVTIGRAPDCTITLGALSVSRRHGRIELRAGVPTYFDEEDAAGSRIDGSFVRGATPLGEKSVLDVGGFRLAVQPAPGAAERPAAPAPARTAPPAQEPDEMEKLFAQKIEGVRSHRQATSGDVAAARARFEAEWLEIIASARRIGQRYATDPRVQSFSVSREGDEVAVKVRDRSQRGYSFFLLTRTHPTRKQAGELQAWLIELGAPERAFPSPKQGLEELLHELAPRLA